jgi:hypothetical protein
MPVCESDPTRNGVDGSLTFIAFSQGVQIINLQGKGHITGHPYHPYQGDDNPR